MIHKLSLRMPPETVDDPQAVRQAAARHLSCDLSDINAVRTERRSLDARGATPKFELMVSVYCHEAPPAPCPPKAYPPVSSKKRVVIVGSGPAGLFAALRLIEHNICPIILERGKDVRSRRFDLKTINVQGICDPDSNYCFGEGGAGTYSDGKLYTRSTKRGKTDDILSVLVRHGAARDILIDTHAHIGSNRLPRIIAAIRQTILGSNGEIHFNSRVTGLMVSPNGITGVRTTDNEYAADAVILAPGHSARDIYLLLHEKGLCLESKPFAAGVRIEHPQALINSIQYGRNAENPRLPGASYRLACQVKGAGVYSFCMCPGGMLVPSATGPGELVLNGMSNSARNLPRANAGIVVTVDPPLWENHKDKGPLAGLFFQQALETSAYAAGGKTMAAPAQRLTDFLADKPSASLPQTSYLPGAVNYPVKKVLGGFITRALKDGFKQFDRKMKGFITREALVLAVESRTSSPVRIPRDPGTRMHPQLTGLFPAGEGSGYSGGIVSSALDGQLSADAAAGFLGAG